MNAPSSEQGFYETYGAVAGLGDCGTCARKELRIACWDLGEGLQIRLCAYCLTDMAKDLRRSPYVSQRLREIANGK